MTWLSRWASKGVYSIHNNIWDIFHETYRTYKVNTIEYFRCTGQVWENYRVACACLIQIHEAWLFIQAWRYGDGQFSTPGFLPIPLLTLGLFVLACPAAALPVTCVRPVRDHRGYYTNIYSFHTGIQCIVHIQLPWQPSISMPSATWIYM